MELEWSEPGKDEVGRPTGGRRGGGGGWVGVAAGRGEAWGSGTVLI